jgi:GT2 family glycosyltransferase
LATIVVANYNGQRHLDALFSHLAQQSVRDFDVVLVDNGSTDASLAKVSAAKQQHGLQIQVIRNNKNLGFAPACNQGIRASRGEWLVMLNNDTRPEPAWLESLLATGESAPNVGMVASKLLRAHLPEQIDSAGIAVDWMGISWDWRGGETDDVEEQDPVEIFGPCGGAALYSRRMLDAIGGFDDDFFAYLEDVDLAWRARLAGWQCLFQPQARVLHAHSGTLGADSPLKLYYLARNKIWLVVKNYPNPWFMRYLPFILGYDLMAVAYGTARQRHLASLRGRLAGLRGLAPFWVKRRRIQQTWHDVENWRRMMAPWASPWAVRARYTHLEKPAVHHPKPATPA